MALNQGRRWTMKFTNRFGFPEYVVDWLSHDEYDYEEGVISATTLLSPPRAYALIKRYRNQLEIDVSELIAAKYGTALHTSIENAPIRNTYIQEKRIYGEIDGIKISGKPDMVKKCPAADKKQHQLIDIKSTSVWTFIYGSKDEDYKKQLSIYRWLLLKNGIETSIQAEILMLFTDWNKSKAKFDPENYPPARLATKKLNLLDYKETESFMKERIALLKCAEKLEDKDLFNCSQEELWQEKTRYALTKPGRKTAIRVFDNLEAANLFLNDSDVINRYGNNIRIETRPGKVKRCNYCLACKFCSQYLMLLKAGMIEGENGDEEGMT